MMNIATKEQMKRAWAFAAYRPGHQRQRLQRFNQAVITSVSKEAKVLGIKAGMRVADARQLLPDLRILLYGSGRS
jgi:nucleotidyltransferase/DNA polymerase involved in DNA repair